MDPYASAREASVARRWKKRLAGRQEDFLLSTQPGGPSIDDPKAREI